MFLNVHKRRLDVVYFCCDFGCFGGTAPLTTATTFCKNKNNHNGPGTRWTVRAQWLSCYGTVFIRIPEGSEWFEPTVGELQPRSTAGWVNHPLGYADCALVTDPRCDLPSLLELALRSTSVRQCLPRFVTRETSKVPLRGHPTGNNNSSSSPCKGAFPRRPAHPSEPSALDSGACHDMPGSFLRVRGRCCGWDYWGRSHVKTVGPAPRPQAPAGRSVPEPCDL